MSGGPKWGGEGSRSHGQAAAGQPTGGAVNGGDGGGGVWPHLIPCRPGGGEHLLRELVVGELLPAGVEEGVACGRMHRADQPANKNPHTHAHTQQRWRPRLRCAAAEELPHELCAGSWESCDARGKRRVPPCDAHLTVPLLSTSMAINSSRSCKCAQTREAAASDTVAPRRASTQQGEQNSDHTRV